MINWISDTIYEFSHRKHVDVYIVGRRIFNRLVLTKMIPYYKPVPEGWEMLTQSMSYSEAQERIKRFPLIRVVVKNKIGA